MAEVDTREKRAAVALIFLVTWPLCWISIQLLSAAGVIDASALRGWLGDKPPLRFLDDTYRDAILSWMWIPFAASAVAIPCALKLAPKVVRRYGHLPFLGLPAGYVEHRPFARLSFRRHTPPTSGETIAYRFTSRTLPFLGRDKQRRMLDEFLAKPEKLLWWWLIGAPGAGKSRTALEWVLSLQGRTGGLLSRTDAGFLLRSASERALADWKPRRPTVIVIDDAGGREEEIRHLLHTLAERQSSFGFPVRVLLVDRKIYDSARTLDGDPVCGADRYKEPLELGGISECLDELARIVGARRHCEIGFTAEGRARILQLTGGSPLFMALALDTIATTDKLTWTSWQDMLRAQATRFESELRDASLPSACLPLLALASFTRGLSWTAAREFLPAISDQDVRLLIRLQYADRDSVLAVQPDVIGECFLLEQVRLMTADEQSRFRERAWGVDGTQTGQTLVYLHRDFPDHPQLKTLSEAPIDVRSAQQWGNWRLDLIHDDPDVEHRKRYRQELLALANRGGPQLALPAAGEAFNRMRACADAGDVSGLSEAWGELRHAASRFPEDQAMQHRLASGAVVAISRFGALQRWDDAAQALEILEDVARRFPNSAEMQLERAMGNRDVILTFGAAKLWTQTLNAWEELQKTARQLPDDSKVQIELALGAADLIDYCGDAGLSELRDQAWHTLEHAATAMPDNPRMQNALGFGALNRMVRSGDPEQVRSSWQILLGIGARAGDDRDLCRVVASATASAIVLFRRINDPENVENACRHLRLLATPLPDDAEICAHLARGTVFEMRHYDKQGALEDFDQAWQRLRSIATTFPANRAILLELARGAYAVYCRHVTTASGRTRAEEAWDWLETANARCPGHPEIIEYLENAPFSPYKM